MSHLTSYFQLQSLLFIAPFKLKLLGDDKFSKVSLASRKHVGKVICIMVQLFSHTCITFTLAYHVLHYNIAAWSVMSMITQLLDQFLYIVTFHIFWRKAPLIENLLNSINKKLELADSPVRSKTVRVIFGPKSFVGFWFILNCVAGYISTYRQDIRIHFLEALDEYVLRDSNKLGQFIRFPIQVGFVFFQRITWVFEILVLSTVVTFLLIVNQFRRDILQNITPREMMVKYAELRELFTSLNDIFSKVFLLHSVVTLFYYVNTPAILTKMSLTRDKMYKIIYVAEHCLALGGASEIHKRIKNSVKDYIYRKKLDEDVSMSDLVKLNILTNEVESDPIGIQCIFYTLNYGLLATYAGIVTTYGIFTWQMQVQHES